MKLFSAIKFILTIESLIRFTACAELIVDIPSNLAQEKMGAKKISAVNIALSRSYDFRSIYCTHETIARRTRESLVAFDLFGLPLGGDPGMKTGEFRIPTNATVRVALEKCGYQKWNGGQPQIRVIGRNAIFQSPLGASLEAKTKAEVEKFLDQLIMPADIIVVTLVD